MTLRKLQNIIASYTTRSDDAEMLDQDISHPKKSSYMNFFHRKILRLISNRKKSDLYNINNNVVFKLGLASSAEFFKRLEGKVDFKNKTVLDIGCGLGSTCYYIVLNGATYALGIDIRPDDIVFAKSKVSDYPGCKDKVEFRLLNNLEPAKFDIVLSKDSFEHYQNPEQFIRILKSYLKPNGKIVIGFSPLWKSPYGAHSWSYSRWPWIHLIFPESVVVNEFRRYFENNNINFENWASGLNKMTTSRYLHIIEESNLKIEYIRFNASSNIKSRCILSLFNAFRVIPGLKEYFTVSVYSILRS